jgi:hypothetical protein
MSKDLEKYKTMCCNAEWYVKSRANFRCKKCDQDVTLEVMLLHQAIEDQEDLKKS